MRVDLVRSPHPPLLEVELEPPANIRERRGLEYEADLNVLFTKRNRVAVYDVFVQQLTEAIDQEILNRLQLKWSATPLLSVVSVHVGCMPDHDCKFTWLRVSCDLGHEIAERRLRPLACKLYPEGSEDPINVVKSFEVSSKLGIKVLEVTTPELSTKESSQKQYESYHYRL